MNTIRFQSPQAFIDALESRRPFWRDFDARKAREHQEGEKQWLVKARAKMREAIKWDYATLKDNLDYGGDLRLGHPPKCPVLMEPKIDRVLASLRLTQNKSFQVDSKGVWAVAHDLLTADPDAPTTAC